MTRRRSENKREKFLESHSLNLRGQSAVLLTFRHLKEFHSKKQLITQER